MRPRSLVGTRRHVAAALIALFCTPASHALQIVDARDGVAVEAILSVKEPTRIRIEGAPITDVFGNIHSSACGGMAAGAPGSPGSPVAPLSPAGNPAGEVVVECDRDKGEIYVRPVAPAGDGSAAAGKPVNLFISSAHATYTLILRRADTPADTILIRDRSAPPAAADGRSASGPSSTSAHHVRAMKALLVAMASDRVPPDVRVDELNQPVQLWAEARFALMRRYEGRGLSGEKYLLQNISATVMVLAEQEFDRPDSKAGGQVLGVAVEHHQLRPGESTSVYVIRRGGER
ncbi:MULTISPECIES: type-F conjugative transfer system secretin TraK [unclassified Methylibium]|uniref:type-F conjugative transfer system secretin TraK n=1 Tax=unclassified Methylibium TaxID=2633235 RepID=UPI0003F40DDA|nr:MULTISPECIES: type-F conjugative transfer system secretin TraK [unclassified Methylibium]EWS56790.1 type-F conjugative transfer system secretin TraK [Methylibium sp. T29]EWS61950.1 type-F conjugative transfer system secretin TraK [Methylibium sp. T29-B]